MDSVAENVTPIETARQPKWQPEEIELLCAIYRSNAPYLDGDYSQFFRMVSKDLPHRTLSGALKKVHEQQIAQTIPYYGALPFTDAKVRDRVAMPYILEKLAEWKEEQAKKATTKKKELDGGDLNGLLVQQNVFLQQILIELQNIRGFIAGIYRRANGEDGKYILVEAMQFAADTRDTEDLLSNIQ